MTHHPEVLKQVGKGPKQARVSHLDHDEFPLPGPPVWPLFAEAQADIEGREAGSLATLVGYHPWTTHTFRLQTQNGNKRKSSVNTSGNYLPLRKDSKQNSLTFFWRSMRFGAVWLGAQGPDQ